MNKIECPYCGERQEVCLDDGYAEDVRYEQECTHCEKTFVFTISIVLYYTPHKADCLNGAEHELQMSKTYPQRYSTMRCKNCDFARRPTEEEFLANGITQTALAKARGEIHD